MRHRVQPGRVGAGVDGQVLVGDGGGFGAAGVHHHQPAAAGLERLEAGAHIGHRHQAAVGGQRVGAQDQHETGAVDFGDGDGQLVAIECLGHHMVG